MSKIHAIGVTVLMVASAACAESEATDMITSAQSNIVTIITAIAATGLVILAGTLGLKALTFGYRKMVCMVQLDSVSDDQYKD